MAIECTPETALDLRCAVCGGESIRRFLSITGPSMLSDGHTVEASFSKAECLACGVVFSVDTDGVDLELLYAEQYRLELDDEPLGQDAESRSTHIGRRVRTLIERSGRSPLRLGEVGAGSGRLLGELSRTIPHCSVWGVDMAPSSHEAGLAAGIAIGVGGPEALPRSLDLVLAVAVLEHAADPFIFVKQCAESLSPTGALILAVPGRLSFSHDYFVLDHLWHFHQEHIARLGRAAGLSIRHFDAANSTSDFDYYLLDAGPPDPLIVPRDTEVIIDANHRERGTALHALERLDAFISSGPHAIGIYGLGERFDFLRSYSPAIRQVLPEATLVDDNPGRAQLRLGVGRVDRLVDVPAQAIRQRRWITTFAAGVSRLGVAANTLHPFEEAVDIDAPRNGSRSSKVKG
jgi:SAM-dependent methyltransferase